MATWMDFTRTTAVHEIHATYGYKTLPHRGSRPKNLQGHDVNRLRSAPYEELRNLEGLTEFRNFAVAALAVLFAALAAVVTALSVIVIRPITPDNAELLGVWPLTALTSAGAAFVLSLFSIFLQLWMRRPRRS